MVESGNMIVLYFSFLIPFVIALGAVKTNYFPLKALVTISCIGILVWARFIPGISQEHSYFIIAAFILSIGGDYFLSFREKEGVNEEHYFLWGIGFFFLAHVAYLLFSSREGSLKLIPLLVLIIFLTAYFLLRLYSGIDDFAMKIAVYLYLLVSCFSMAFVLGYQGTGAARIGLTAGIGLILFSDFAIGETLFCKKEAWSKWILPTYYAAHMVLTLGLVV